jgi:hypothetical protein
MSDYDNTNSGVLFGNFRKSAESDPDYTGSLNVMGVDFNFAGIAESESKINVSIPEGVGMGSMERTDKEGRSEKYPDWRGHLDFSDGRKVGIAAWKRVAKKSGNPFLSIKAEPIGESDGGHQPQRDATPSDSSVPF